MIRRQTQNGSRQFVARTRTLTADESKQRPSEGIPTWGETEIEAFRRHHPLGSRARLALELLLHTGQRRGDVIRMGRQHVQGGVIQVTQQKTGAKLVIPLHSDLLEAVAAVPSENLTFLTTPSGSPFSARGFTAWFRQQCDAAGVRGFSAHGLRKAACRRLAEAGCTEKQIAAISGHKSLAEIARYTRAADQSLLARAAVDKMRTSAVKQPDPDCQTMAQGTGNKGK